MFAANEGILDEVDNIVAFKKDWFEYFDANLSELAKKLNDGAALADEDKETLKNALENLKAKNGRYIVSTQVCWFKDKKMANLKDIKSRISSVENTKKITRAMKMVAAAKVKKAENNVKASRPFSEELNKAFKKLLVAVGDYSSSGTKIDSAIENYPAFLKEREIKSAGILVITSNKGLAGAYNANVIRNVLKKIQEYKDKGIESKVFVVGQKGISSLKRKSADLGFEIIQSYTKVANEISAAGAEAIAQDLAESFVSGQIDSIEIFTTKFKNMMSYSAERWELFPLNLDISEEKAEGIDPVMLFEPNEQTVFAENRTA